jgi:site-specific DNA-methyltransferase (adenine-specific)
MVIPARWFAGGKGLDGFRDAMLNDTQLRVLEDFPNSNDVFVGTQIKGGVCYFLWEKDNHGMVTVRTNEKGVISSPMTRPLLEDGSDVFIRYNEAISIIKKIFTHENSSSKKIQLDGKMRFSSLVSARKPFGFDTSFRGKKVKNTNDLIIYQNSGVGYIDRSLVTKNQQIIDKWKIFISYAYGAGDSFPHFILGKPFVGAPGTVCSETYVFIGPFDSETIANNVVSYIRCKLFRFLVLLHKPTQHATQSVYTFVPEQDFTIKWTDDMLYKKYGINQSEIDFIDRMIRPMTEQEDVESE